MLLCSFLLEKSEGRHESVRAVSEAENRQGRKRGGMVPQSTKVPQTRR